MNNVSAVQLSELLASRHSGDVFVPQCKMGAVGSRILDGWALLPTWSPLTSIGYEIKVSRSDWLKDQKFEEYRPACHLFFIVAPTGVIRNGELPDGVGLLEPIGQGNGRRLVMRSKAVRQQVDMKALAHVMAHVLMWRKDQQAVSSMSKAQRANFWRTWVNERKEFELIGRSVRGRMRQILRDAIDDKHKAETLAKQLDDVQQVLKELGISPPWSSYTIKRRIERELTCGGDQLVSDLGATIQHLTGLRSRLVDVLRDSTKTS